MLPITKQRGCVVTDVLELIAPVGLSFTFDHLCHVTNAPCVTKMRTEKLATSWKTKPELMLKGIAPSVILFTVAVVYHTESTGGSPCYRIEFIVRSRDRSADPRRGERLPDISLLATGQKLARLAATQHLHFRHRAA